MNNLSWMLYLADVIPGLGSFWGVLAGFSLVATIVANGIRLIGIGIHNDCAYGGTPKREYALIPYSGRIVALALLAGTIVALIPSSKTFYMIAASEAGEAVIANPEAQQIFDALKERIKSELSIASEAEKKG